MARKPEDTYVVRVHSKLPPAGEFYRMKNNNPYVGGIPDWWYSPKGGRDLWVEYKFLPELPARQTTLIDPLKLLSSLQNEWLNSRHAEGRNVACIIGSPVGAAILTDLSWTEPQQHTAFRHSPLQVAKWIIERCSTSSTQCCNSSQPPTNSC